MRRRRRRPFGGPAPTPGTDYLLQEIGDRITLEDGSGFILI